MSTIPKHVSNSYIQKIFPIGFNRGNDYYDHFVSEENLVDWIRGITPDSVSSDNSPHSCVVSKIYDPSLPVEFLLGGYYVKMNYEALNVVEDANNVYVYLSVSEGSDEFRRLLSGDAQNLNNEFRALTFTSFKPESFSNNTYVLHLATRDRGSSAWYIPPTSKQATLIADGGVIE